MKNIQKNKMGKYRYYFNYEGKRYQGSWCNSLALAREQLFEAQAKVRKDGFIDNKQITFRQVHDWFMEDHKLRVKESTLNKEIGDCKNHVLPKFGDYPIASITVDYCQSVYDEWAIELGRHDTMKLYASRVFKEAIRRDIISKNPFDYVKKPKEHKKPKERKFLERDEFITFMQAAQKFDIEKYLMVRLLAYTGMRRGELFGLTWADIDFNNCTVDINKGFTLGLDNKKKIDTPKNDSSYRVLKLDTETIELLAKWKQQQALRIRANNLRVKRDDKQFLFASQKKNEFTHPNKVYKVINDLIKVTGIKKHITPHGLRHTWATLFVEGSGEENLMIVQKQLGHKSVRTTQDIYTHLTENKKSQGIDMFLEGFK